MSRRPRETLLSLKPSRRPADPVEPDQPPPAARHRPWYARPWVLVVAVVVLGGGAAVLVDLPHHTTKVQRVKEAAAVVDSVDSSIHECAYAVAQAFSLYHEDRTGTLDPAEHAQLPGLVSDDAKACSFANTSVALLGTDIFGTLTLSSTPAARDLTAMVDSVLDWEATDALAAVEDIRSLIADPRDAKAAAQLADRERFLFDDRAAADADIDRARKLLGTSHVPYPTLPSLPHP
jgi:hypothetical protein